MKKSIMLILALIIIMFSACSTTPEKNNPTANTEIIGVRYNKFNKDALIDDIIIPFYLPQQLSDGTQILCGLHKQGSKAEISTGEQMLVDIDYYKAASDELSETPELGKAALATNGDSFTLVMLINENIGCVMISQGISKEELIKVADSFYVNRGPAPVS